MVSPQCGIFAVICFTFMTRFPASSAPLQGSANSCEHEMTNGPNPLKERSGVDGAKHYTFVFNTKADAPGYTTKVTFVSKVNNRPLRVGVYQPVGEGDCNFKLKASHTIPAREIKKGNNNHPVSLKFEMNDHIGFTWTNYGVVAYEGSGKNNFCTKNGAWKVGQEKQMSRSHGDRIYSFSATVIYLTIPQYYGVFGQNFPIEDVHHRNPYTFIGPYTAPEDTLIAALHLNVKLAPPSTTFTVCGIGRKISCSGKRVVSLISAQYVAVEECSAVLGPQTNQCQMQGALEFLQRKCQGKRSCKVKAADKYMGTLNCAKSLPKRMLEVTYACQDENPKNLLDDKTPMSVEELRTNRISEANKRQTTGFTYRPFPAKQLCSDYRQVVNIEKAEKCGLVCDLDQDCDGFYMKGKDCKLVSKCQEKTKASMATSGYRKAGDMVIATYRGDRKTTQTKTYTLTGGVCRLRVQQAAVIRNIESGSQVIRFQSPVAIQQGDRVGMTFLTASLYRVLVSQDLRRDYPTFCQRDAFPSSSMFNYPKGDGSNAYEYRVEFLASGCPLADSAFGAAIGTNDPDCKDQLSSETCNAAFEAGVCNERPYHFMVKKYCQQTCNLCHEFRPTCSPGQTYRLDSNLCEGHCIDKTSACRQYPKQGKCNLQWIRQKCPVSCGVCQQSCSRGYTLKNDKCIDINECKKDKSICPANARCVNRNGYYECLCKSNYIFKTLPSSTEKGTCSENVCKDKKPASYCKRYKDRCFDAKRQKIMLRLCKKSCGLCDIDCDEEGHMIQKIDSKLQCVDIDECKRKDLHKCGKNAVCKNTPGSYNCECTEDKPLGDPKKICLAKCEDGYHLVGTKCRRMNPCKYNLHTCPDNARCKITRDAYRCVCPRGQTDVLDATTGQHKCIREMLCRASGDPHFYTFDLEKIDFMGICVYDLVTTQCPGQMAVLPEGLTPFTIHVKNHHRSGNTRVSFLEYLEVEIGQDVVRLDQGKVVLVNGVRVNLPYIKDDNLYTVHKEGQNVVFRLKSGGLRILWSGSTRVFVYIDEQYGGHVCGLCGNADGNAKNDMITKGGELTKSDAVLGDSWQVDNKGGEKCETPTEELPKCTDNQNKEFIKACSVMAQGSFTVCNEELKPDEIIEECAFDLCAEFEGDTEANLEEIMMETLCDYYKEYADLCQLRGILVEWDKDTICPHNPQCPPHSQYIHSIECSPSCADPLGLSTCLDQPVGGCQCKPGLFQDMDACVPLDQCGCTYEEEYYAIGEIWVDSDCTKKYRCAGYNSIESWDIDCDTFVAVCGSVVPNLGDTMRRGCYCLEQPNQDMPQMCDEPVGDTIDILPVDPVDIELDPPIFLDAPFFDHVPETDPPAPIIDDFDQPIVIDDPLDNCEDKLSIDTCEKYRDEGSCSDPRQFQESRDYCQKTCQLCNVERPPCPEGHIYRADTNLCAPHCMNTRDDCDKLFAQDKCDKKWVKRRCPVSCGLCEMSCSRGYNLVNGTCVDINECETDQIQCMENGRCSNRKGYYKCVCRAGYEMTGIYNYLTGEGVCQEKPCADKRSEAFCAKRITNCFDPKRQPAMLFNCKNSCGLCSVDCDKPGYMINAEKQCVDINECEKKELHKCGKNAVCQNTDGGYECICPDAMPLGDPKKRCLEQCEEGYYLDGLRCRRINYCKTGLHTCPEDARCQMTKESYRCRCPRGETDVIDQETGRHKCYREFACIARGDPHYYTFDGVKIDYQSTCKHQLLGTNCPAHISPLPEDLIHFQIIVQNHHRNGKTRVSFLRDIIIQLNDEEILLGQKGLVLVNGQQISVPYSSDLYDIVKEGENVVFALKSNGVKVVWSTTTSVTVYVDELYEGHVCGICGDADHNKENDMVTSEGKLVTSEVEVGDSWKVNDPEKPECKEIIEDVPDCSEEQNAKFRMECELIMESPFDFCHNAVNPEKFIAECMFDLCAETQGQLDTQSLAISVETKCDHYKHYADECLREGVLVDWNKDGLCPYYPQCPENSFYSHDVTCSESCADPEGLTCLDQPMGGCQCEEGFFQDGDAAMTCVEPHLCGCMEGDIYYSIGKTWLSEDCTKMFKCVAHSTKDVWDIFCNDEEAVCSNTVPGLDITVSHGCYCVNQPDEGVIHTCEDIISGPSDGEKDDDILIEPPVIVDPLPFPFPGFLNDAPFGPPVPNDQPEDDNADNNGDDDDQVVVTTEIEPPFPNWPIMNDIIRPKLNESEDNSYFQLEPEVTPQLKPRPLGMESCVVKESRLSASSEQPGGEAYRARPLSCNSQEPPSGWMPEEEDDSPYLQIDLGSKVDVHGTGTLGHYNKTCWVKRYKVLVSDTGEEGSFTALKDKETGEDKIFGGNSDHNTWRHFCFHQYYEEPVRTRFIRIVPLDQELCKAMRVELYGFRAADDPDLLDALEDDAWTKKTTGCQCYFDRTKMDCACCENGGCQCPTSNKHQCVQCGYATHCGIPEHNDDKDQLDPWTKTPSGCPCPDDPFSFDCACCQKMSCNCGALQPNQCVECGHTETHCGEKPEIFGPPPVCVPKSCP